MERKGRKRLNQSKRVVDALKKLPDSGESCSESLEASGLNKQSGNTGKRRKKTKRFRFSYKTVLSLCLISGLSIGVGTAFANDVQPPDKFRSLEPAANVNVEEELDLPPKDPDIEKSEKTTSQKATTDETKNDSQKSESQNTETKNSSTSTKETSSPSQSSEQKVAEVTSTKQDGEKKALTTSQPANQTTSTKPTEKNKSSEEAPTPSPPPNKPVTEKGGKLPDTAGRDLEGVLFGGLIAILGVLYILLKGRKANKS